MLVCACVCMWISAYGMYMRVCMGMCVCECVCACSVRARALVCVRMCVRMRTSCSAYLKTPHTVSIQFNTGLHKGVYVRRLDFLIALRSVITDISPAPVIDPETIQSSAGTHITYMCSSNDKPTANKA